MEKIISVKNVKYKYYFLEKKELIEKFKKDKTFLNSFIKIMKLHRGKNSNIRHLKYDKKDTFH